MSTPQSAAHGLLADPAAEARLRQLALRLKPRREAVLERWAERYAAGFAAGRFFSGREFVGYFGRELDAILDSLAAGDEGRLVVSLTRAGQELCAMGVSFAELVGSLHLFEEACLIALAGEGGEPTLEDHRTLDRLSHLRIALLAEAYVGRREEEHLERQAALERGLAEEGRDREKREEFMGLVGRSAAMQVLYGRLESAGHGEGPVLMVGEEGSGKELAARAIHLLSARSSGPFVAASCASLRAPMLDSELFGHRRGPGPAGAGESEGLLRAARDGTLFLDQLSALPLDTQARLLRALEDRAVRPLGQARSLPADFRLVASVDRDPDTLLRQGALLPALHARLAGLRIDLPALRDRLGDLPLLARRILDRAGLGHVELTVHALQRLRGRLWPGNIRELESVLVAAASAAPHGRIRVIDLPRPAGLARVADEAVSGPREGEIPTLREAETALIERALRATRGNKLRAAQLLGVSRKWLYARLGGA